MEDEADKIGVVDALFKDCEDGDGKRWVLFLPSVPGSPPLGDIGTDWLCWLVSSLDMLAHGCHGFFPGSQA